MTELNQENVNLSKKEELELGGKIRAMVELKEAIKDDETRVLTKEEEEILEVGEIAFEKLVSSNYNLARSRAIKLYKQSGTKYSLEDLMQDAIVALIEAALNYNPDQDCKLSTFAFYGITKKVTSTINYQRLVRMPENKMGDYIKISEAQKEYQALPIEKKADYSNELDYVYKHVSISKEDVNLILRNMQPQMSLNSPLYEDEGEMISNLVDENAEEELNAVEYLDKNVLDVLSKLTPYEKDLVAFEYGVHSPSMPYEEFKMTHDLTDKDVKLQVNKLNKKMRKLGSQMTPK